MNKKPQLQVGQTWNIDGFVCVLSDIDLWYDYHVELRFINSATGKQKHFYLNGVKSDYLTLDEFIAKRPKLIDDDGLELV